MKMTDDVEYLEEGLSASLTPYSQIHPSKPTEVWDGCRTAAQSSKSKATAANSTEGSRWAAACGRQQRAEQGKASFKALGHSCCVQGV